MATAKKQASGNWKIRVYDYTDSQGKQHYKAFTGRTKKEAERLALQWHGGATGCDITLGEAAWAHIESRRSVLSPSTIKGYVTHAKQIEPISHIKTSKISQYDIQHFISSFASTHSPKTVRNVHGFISTVLRSCRPDLKLETTLPQKIPDDIYIASQEEVAQIIKISKQDPALYRAVLLAAYGPLRRSEICALESADLKNGIIHVCKAMVEDETGTWYIKQPKTRAGDRYIPLPSASLGAFRGVRGRFVPLTPAKLTERFSMLLKKHGIHHMRLHSLRHYCASELHALGMPDAYIMERGGWESDSVLKQIYRHTLSGYQSSENDRVNAIFNQRILEKHDPKHDP